MVTWHHNEWYPDTCECGIQIVFDDDIPDNMPREHLFFAKLQPCRFHPNLEGNTLYNVVKSENNTIQNLRRWLCENISSMQEVFTNEDGTKYTSIKKGITLKQSWSGLDSNRTVTISFDGITLTSSQKNLIQDACNQLFGNGKVSIS